MTNSNIIFVFVSNNINIYLKIYNNNDSII